MKAKELLDEVARILNIGKDELAIEHKGKSLIVRRYNDEVEGMIVAKYNARRDAIEII